jgi:hypothetical protein
MKRCSRCGDFKLRVAFYRDARAKSGLSSYCKVCNDAQGTARRIRLRQQPARDPWAELGPIYRRRNKMGRMGTMSRLGRSASKIIAVLYRSGKPMMPWNYALKPFTGPRSGYSTCCIYFRWPVMTAGLTVLFEGGATRKR